MGRSLGVKQIMAKKYSVYNVNEEWKNAVGTLADPFTMLVYGRPKNGKTSFIMKLCKYLTEHGKVYYNSAEEGDSKTIQDALRLAKMDEVEDGKFILGDNDTFIEMCEKLKKNRCKICVIDSLDYMRLTTEQFKKLIVQFPNKSFIIICWEKRGKPGNYYAKEIEFQVGCVVHVKNFEAFITSRYGGLGPKIPYTIWEKKKELTPLGF
jgi:nucleoside-triphosphatase THEP1